MNEKIAFIGAGNMATSMISGLLKHHCSAQDIIAADIEQHKLQSVHEQFHIETTTDNLVAIAEASVIIFAVKPQIMKQAAKSLSAPLQTTRPLILSIAAGIRTHHISQWLGDLSIIRCMPNTPALIQLGATGAFANTQVSEAQKQTAQAIIESIGACVWIEQERYLDIVTALSGSGPAYFFLFMEALENAAQALDLPADISHLLTLQTGLGAATMAMQSKESLATLRQKVTSPGGTTEQAILSFEKNQFNTHIQTAINSAYHRSIELSQQYGDE